MSEKEIEMLKIFLDLGISESDSESIHKYGYLIEKVFNYINQLEEENKQLKFNRDEAIEEIKDLLEHWKGNDLVERDLNILLSILERGKE